MGKQRKDLSNQKFQDLLVLHRGKIDKWGKSYWICKCMCGEIIETREDTLTKQNKKDCGCGHRIANIGEKFGLLTVTKILPSVKIGRSTHGMRECLCDCGNKYEARSVYLQQGRTKSCGCWKTKFNKRTNRVMPGEIPAWYWNQIEKGAKNRFLDFFVTPEYMWDIFNKQKGLCALSGLEIKFCKKRKRNDNTASIDRIDSNIGYVESNVQWVHKKINIMKNKFTQPEFIVLCTLVSRSVKSP